MYPWLLADSSTKDTVCKQYCLSLKCDTPYIYIYIYDAPVIGSWHGRVRALIWAEEFNSKKVSHLFSSIFPRPRTVGFVAVSLAVQLDNQVTLPIDPQNCNTGLGLYLLSHLNHWTAFYAVFEASCQLIAVLCKPCKIWSNGWCCVGRLIFFGTKYTTPGHWNVQH